MSDTTRLRKDLGTERVDGQLLVLDKSSGQIHQLNATASLVWDGLENGLTNQEIAATMCDQFDVVEDQVAGDVEQVINEFSALGLIDEN